MIPSPFISIIIPCYNEERFIGQCLDSILAGDYPAERMEVLVVDGGSQDNTRNIISDYSKRHASVRLVDNPHRLKPHALNIGISAAKGNIVIRMDVHSQYDPEYVSKSVQYLDQLKADNVGGLRMTFPGNDSLFARSIAASISSRFGAGNATYRTGAKGLKWVDTVFGGCYRKEIFAQIGMFDERLVRGQDREFNVRLQRAGGKILFVPDIICSYYARGSLLEYLPWIYAGGLTPFYVSRLIGLRIYSWRNLVPMTFVSSLLLLIPLSFLNPIFLFLLLTELACYLICAIIASIPVAKKEKNWLFLITMPVVFFLSHIFYGVGSFAGLLKSLKGDPEWTKH